MRSKANLLFTAWSTIRTLAGSVDAMVLKYGGKEAFDERLRELAITDEIARLRRYVLHKPIT